MLFTDNVPINSSMQVAREVAAEAWRTAPTPTRASLEEAFWEAVKTAYLPAPWEVPGIVFKAYCESIVAEPTDIPYQLVRLMTSPAWHGAGIPEGKGRGVLFVPGFLAPAWSGDLMLSIFEQRGYRTKKADIGRVNVRCPDRTGEDLLLQTNNFADECGEEVILVGHSLGGAVCGFVLTVAPELVYHAFAMGSPLNGKDGVHPLLHWAWEAMAPVRTASGASDPGCANASCECRANLFARGAWRGEMHKFTAIVGDDPLVDRRKSTKIGMTVKHIPGAYHCSMILNPDVLQAMGRTLTDLRGPQLAPSAVAVCA